MTGRSTRRGFFLAAGLLAFGGMFVWFCEKGIRPTTAPIDVPSEFGSPMDAHDWRRFLEQYSEELVATDIATIVIPPEVRESRWMGFAPATPAAIQEAEQRLGRKLPVSLRNFYSVTNGWRATGFFIWDILPVEKIGWLSDHDSHLYHLVCEVELTPGPFKKDPDGSRLREYRHEQGTRVKRSLVITSRGDAAYWLLDPDLKPHDGEWPGGRWASWNPAMNWTASSFEDLMKQEFKSFREVRDHNALMRR